MGILTKFKNAFSRKNKMQNFEMITQNTASYFGFKGRLYDSDIVRATIRPKARAIGKAVAKHVRTDQVNKGLKQDARADIRFVLEEPNDYMTMQMLLEKLTVQLELNNNAFAYIEHGPDGMITAIYPIDCSNFVLQQDAVGNLYLKFQMYDGKFWTADYKNIIHLRKDYSNSTFVGDSPAKAIDSLMDAISTSDQGMINAIKNSSAIRWLLKYAQALKAEDLEKRAKEFAGRYISTESETGGVMAVGADAEAIQLKSDDYVPNAAQTDRLSKRIFNYFNTNEKIVSSSYTEDEWIAYYESCIEPDLIQLSNEFTRKFFTRNERSYGNKIIFVSSNLSFVSMSTKLNLVQFVDRGIMTPNELREILGYEPLENGDKPIRRLDTRTIEETDNEDNTN